MILPLLFGVFQAGMASLGWLGGALGGDYIAAWDHWVAFGLLVVIGGKMIIEAWRGERRRADAGLAAALSRSRVRDEHRCRRRRHHAAARSRSPPWLALVLIGVITTALLGARLRGGRALGQRVGPSSASSAACVLIAIGIDILIRAPDC